MGEKVKCFKYKWKLCDTVRHVFLLLLCHQCSSLDPSFTQLGLPSWDICMSAKASTQSPRKILMFISFWSHTSYLFFIHSIQFDTLLFMVIILSYFIMHVLILIPFTIFQFSSFSLLIMLWSSSIKQSPFLETFMCGNIWGDRPRII